VVYDACVGSAHDTLRVLIELTRHLSVDEPLETSLRAVMSAALALGPARHASVRLFDETGSALLSGGRAGEGSSHEPVDFRPGEGLIGWVAEHGERLRLDDAPADPRFMQKAAQGFEVRSYLAVPLTSQGRVMGVLALTSSELGAFTEEDELLTQLLANCTVPFFERARLRQLALTDDQTHAYNRRYLLPRLRREIEAARRLGMPLTLLSLDVDLFKDVNDAYGHARGDGVLLGFVSRVLESVRSRDVLVRRGGDEFVLLMPGTPLAMGERVAERIRAAIGASPIDTGTPPVTLTVTIGVAGFDGHEPAERLEERADAAMYEGKRRGRDCVVVAR
jgi:two-component system, cell cycle response regulator